MTEQSPTAARNERKLEQAFEEHPELWWMSVAGAGGAGALSMWQLVRALRQGRGRGAVAFGALGLVTAAQIAGLVRQRAVHKRPADVDATGGAQPTT